MFSDGQTYRRFVPPAGEFHLWFLVECGESFRVPLFLHLRDQHDACRVSAEARGVRAPDLGGRVSVEASWCRRVALVGHNFVQIVTP